MLTKFARHFVVLGEDIANAKMVLYMADSHEEHEPERQLKAEEIDQLRGCVEKIVALCEELELPVAKTIFENAQKDLPKTHREFEILTNALDAELKNKLFVFVPSHRQKFMQPRHFMGEKSKEAFPKARRKWPKPVGLTQLACILRLFFTACAPSKLAFALWLSS